MNMPYEKQAELYGISLQEYLDLLEWNRLETMKDLEKEDNYDHKR